MQNVTRRDVLIGPPAAAIVTLASAAAVAQTPQVAPQHLLESVCGSTLVPIQSWGNIPEYVWGAPQRTSLIEPGMTGQYMLLRGRVLTTNCRPIANARLEFWQTNADGKYDMGGYRFRALQNAGQDGRYQLETIMPGQYSPQRHIHFLVGVRTDLNRSGLLVTNAVNLPTDQQIGRMPAHMPQSDSSWTGAISKQGRLLVIDYDMVIQVS